MKFKRTTTGLAVLAAAALTVACEVDQTQEARAPDVDVDAEEGNLPEYEVTKTEEGRMPDVDVDVKGGQMPKYDVDVADVDVGTKEKTVTVPDVDVTMPDDEEDPD